MQRGPKELADAFAAAGLTDKASPDALLVAVAIAYAVETLTEQVRLIAHGDESGPSGLEGVAISVAGSGLRDSLTKAVRSHGEAVRSVGDALAKIVDLMNAEVKS